jgi:hypothetical protein
MCGHVSRPIFKKPIVRRKEFDNIHEGDLLEVVSKPHLRPNGCVAPLVRDSYLILKIRVQHSPGKCSHTHVCCAFSIGLRLDAYISLFKSDM